MRKTKALFIFSLAVFALATVADAQTYRWVDEHGSVYFADSSPLKKNNFLAEITSPVKGKTTPSFDVPSVQNSPDVTNAEVLSFDAVPEPTSPHTITVELYTTSWCPYCKDARNFFLSRGISFSEYDIEKDEEAARRKNDLDGGRGVPFVVICDQKIHGFSTVAYERALALCGQ